MENFLPREGQILQRVMENEIDDPQNHGAEAAEQKSPQKEILYGVIYGALLGLNWGEKMRNSRDMEQAVIDTAEFQAGILMRPYLKDGEELQGYMCVYIPLQRILEKWEQK